MKTDMSPKLEAAFSFASFMNRMNDHVETVRTSTTTPFKRVLLHGSSQSDISAVAKKVAVDSGFPDPRLIDNDMMLRIEGFKAKALAVANVFVTAYKSPLSLIIIDKIEDIIEHSPLTRCPSFALVYNVTHHYLNEVPKEGRLLVIGTTTNRQRLKELDLLNCFDAEEAMPVMMMADETHNNLVDPVEALNQALQAHDNLHELQDDDNPTRFIVTGGMIPLARYILQTSTIKAEDLERAFRRHCGCWYDEKVCQLFLDYHPDFGKFRNDGEEPAFLLFNAIRHSFSLDVIKALLARGPESAGWVDENGFLPIHFALKHKASGEVVLALLEHFPQGAQERVIGESRHRNDYGGYLPLHIAVKNRSPIDVVQIIVDHYPAGVSDQCNSRSTLHLACSDGSLETVQFLIGNSDMPSKGLDVANPFGFLPLHFACRRPSPDYLELFQEVLAAYPQGACVADNGGRLPLHILCRRIPNQERLLMIRSVLQIAPLSILAAQNDGMTPLRLAFNAYRGDNERSDETWRFLLQKQDEAAQVLETVLTSLREQHGLPDLTVANVKEFVVLDELWRLAEEE